MTRPRAAYQDRLARDFEQYNGLAYKYNQLLAKGEIPGFTPDPSEYDRNLTRLYILQLEREFVSSVVGNNDDQHFCSEQVKLAWDTRQLDLVLTKFGNSQDQVSPSPSPSP